MRVEEQLGMDQINRYNMLFRSLRHFRDREAIQQMEALFKEQFGRWSLVMNGRQ